MNPVVCAGSLVISKSNSKSVQICESYILLSLKERPAAITVWNTKQKQKQGGIKNPPHRVNKVNFVEIQIQLLQLHIQTLKHRLCI